MDTISNPRTTAIAFFLVIKLVCVSANLISTVEPESLGFISWPTYDSTSFNDDSDIDPLPADIFSSEVSDFLSLDIFSQTNPYLYLLNKTKNLSFQTINKINSKLHHPLLMDQFPKRYIPYAKFVSSLLPCLMHLEEIKESTINIRRFTRSTHPSMAPELFAQDPELQQLFSSYVFSDTNPPIRLLRKLTDIAENEISNLSTRVQNLLNHRHFPRRYSRFTKCLLEFLKMKYPLRNLKRNIVEIQSLVSSSIPQGEKDSNIQADDDLDLQAEDSGPLDQHIATENVSISPKLVTLSLNNDQFQNALPKKSFKREVRNFLLPDMFSQADPFAYFLAKTVKLPIDVLQQINFHVTYYLDRDEFPERYIPYAELATSLLSCLLRLENIGEFVDAIRRSNDVYHQAFILHPDISKFFTDDIFYNSNPRIRILLMLLDMPEIEISNVTIQLQKLLKNKYFSGYYWRYGNALREFLDRDFFLIQRLKDNIVVMQRVSQAQPK